MAVDGYSLSCFTPLSAWQSKFVRPSTGKTTIIFKPPSGKNFEYIQLPCGQCVGCRLDRSKDWAVRIWHESQFHDESCFITLTYNEDFLPEAGSLVKRDWQLFMKRLRKAFPDKRIRFFSCGEYGEQFSRPHYHAILFGIDFYDRYLFRRQGGRDILSSHILQSLWSEPKGLRRAYGDVTVDNVTYDCAAYVARYCLKKITGDSAADYYDGVLPEYVLMSRRGGIGLSWFEKYRDTDVFPQGFVVLRGGFKQRVPKYYDRKYELTNPEDFDLIRSARVLRAKGDPDNHPDRLRDRHVVAKAKCNLKVRSFEKHG